MSPAADLIERIWLRSRTLDEILQQGSEPLGEARFPHGLRDWVRAFSPDDDKALARRLEWDEIPVARAEAALQGRLTLPGPDQAFHATLERLAGIASLPCVLDDSLSDVPFIHLWQPFLALAIEDTPQNDALLQPEAWTDLTRQLALQLAWCGVPSAWQAFEARRASGYDAFCQAYRNDILGFFSEHATLLRRLLLIGRQWSDATRELLERLVTDREEIERLSGSSAVPVARIRAGVSDRHGGGRQVAILTSSSGRRFVYKPRPTHSLARFNDLLRWYASVDSAHAPETIEVVERDHYAWIEFIEQSAFDSVDQVRDYYRRSGALLFFAWLLGGRDLHMDNVIASKKSAVIVDTEVFAQPAWSRGASTGALQVARDRVSSSVVGTGMLSFPQQDEAGGVFEIGGLAGSGGYLSPSRRRWHDVNTDKMRFIEERRVVEPMENVVRLDEEIVGPAAYVDEIIEGFTAAFETAAAHRDHLAANGGPLDRFREAESRLLFRPSNQYATLLRLLIGPACSRLGVTASLYVESLARVFANVETRPELWPLVRQERESLENLDIPLFTIDCDADEIVARSGETIRGLIEKPGVEALLSRVRDLDRDDLHEQVRLIAATLASTKPHVGQDDETPLTSFHPPRRESISEAIDRIGAAILDAAVEGEDDAVTWIDPEYVRISSLADLGATYYLYSGVTGISLFLGAWGRVRRHTRALELSRRAWVPLERLLESGDINDVSDHLRLGIANGIGSIAYAAALAKELTGDSSLLSVATGFGEMLSQERLRRETALDVEGGVAGAALALHALYDATGDQTWLDRARSAAQRLVEAARRDGDGLHWRSDSESPPLAGMAHGAAGIGLALATVGRAARDNALRDAAEQAFRWERTRFDPETGNWPVRTNDGRSINMVAWCHGAPGIGLSRIGAALESEKDREDLELAAQATRASGVHPVDHVCCGNSGRIDFLVDAAVALDDTLILDEARHRAGAIVSRAAHRGSFALVEETRQTFRPGFFRGLAGIGYTLLRALEPGSLPSITRFQLKGDVRA